MTTRADVVAEALTWLRTPYHHEGDVKGVGTDCAMILVRVYGDLGLIPRIDPRPYPRDWHMHRSEEKYLGWVQQYADPVETPEPGDVVLYKFGRCVSHAGIVIEWPLILHAYVGQGVVYGTGDRGHLQNRIAGFWRVRGLES